MTAVTVNASDLLDLLEAAKNGKAQILEVFAVDAKGGANIGGKYYTAAQLAKRKAEQGADVHTLTINLQGEDDDE